MPPRPRPSCWRASTTRPRARGERSTSRAARPRRRPRSRVVDQALQGVAGVLALAGHADLDAGDLGPPRRPRRHRRARSRPALEDRRRRRARDGVEELNAALVAARDVALGPPPRPPPHGAGRRRPRRPRRRRRSALAGFTAVQVALSALDRLEVRGRDSAGLHLLVWDHGLDLESDVVAAAAGRPRRRSRSSPPARSGWPTGTWPSSTRPRPRSASWATTPRRCAPPSRDDGLLHLALGVAVGPRDGAGPHPLGERRHHLRAQRPPAQPRGGGRVAGAVRGRRAERRRRQPRRPEGRATACASRPPSPPTPRSSPPSCRARRRRTADLTEAFRRTVASFEGSVAIGAVVGRPARQGAGWPSGAAARPSTWVWPRTPSSWPASRTAWSRRRPTTCASTVRRRCGPTSPAAAARSSSSTVHTPGGSRASARLAYDGTELPSPRPT